MHSCVPIQVLYIFAIRSIPVHMVNKTPTHNNNKRKNIQMNYLVFFFFLNYTPKKKKKHLFRLFVR